MRPLTLVLVLVQVAGATIACAEHGDRPTFHVVRSAHRVFADAAASAGGRIVKALGDGLMLTFPPERAREAVARMRDARNEANALWLAFDSRCEVQLKATIGTVLVGQLTPDDPRPDVFGNVVNQLFKSSGAGVMLTPELEALL